MRGTADIAFGVPGYTPGRFPLSSIADLPFSIPSSMVGTKTMWELFQKGYLDKEYSETKVLALTPGDTNNMFLAKNKPMTLAEFKGLKIRSAGAYVTKSLEAAGIVPVSIPGPEIYPSMERGIVDGSSLPSSVATAHGMPDIAKYVAVVDLGSVSIFTVMNKNSFAKLSQQDQVIFDNMREELGMLIAETYDQYHESEHDAMRKAGADVYVFPAAEKAKWVEACKPVYTSWLEDMKSKGVEGQPVFDDFVAILAKQGVKLPF